MDKYSKAENEKEYIPVWLVSLVVLGVLSVLTVLLVSFFITSPL